MKGFIFRLDRLLKLRFRAERNRAQRLGLAIRNAEARRKAREEADAHLDRCGEQMNETANGVNNAGNLRNLSLAVRVAAHQAKAAEDGQRQSEDAVRVEEERFGRARQERRVMERVRERRRKVWSIEAARKEQRDLDNLVQQRWGRRGEP
jgi:flagellar FliJ protein